MEPEEPLLDSEELLGLIPEDNSKVQHAEVYWSFFFFLVVLSWFHGEKTYYEYTDEYKKMNI